MVGFVTARTYSSSEPCPQCNKSSGMRTQCESCHTVGCNSASCRHGGSGYSYCKVCGNTQRKTLSKTLIEQLYTSLTG